MRFISLFVALLPLLPAFADDAITEQSRTIRIGPQEQPALVQAIAAPAPAGALSLEISVETADPAHDVDLLVRFVTAPEIVSGLPVADFSSATPGAGAEAVTINASSEPPLQNGLYFIALHVRTLNTEIHATVRIRLETGGPQRTFLISTFEGDRDDGWRRNFIEPPPFGSSRGDPGSVLQTTGGVLRIVESGLNRDYAVAPAKFLGDLSAYSNARFQFRYRQGGAPAIFPLEMRVIGGGSVWVWRGPTPPLDEWVEVTVPLGPAGWNRELGAASFERTLSRVEGIEISMDQAPEAERDELDDFSFAGEAAASPGGVGQPATSSFEESVDGWSRNYPASAIPGASIGSIDSELRLAVGDGQESQGYLEMVDNGGGLEDHAVAPAKFLTGLSQLDRPWYEFWVRRIGGAFPQTGMTLRLLGGGSVFEWVGSRPREGWQRFRTPLDARYWKHVEGPNDFVALLAAPQRLEVRMDYASGPETTAIDEFSLRAGFVAPEGRELLLGRESVLVRLEEPAPSSVVETVTVASASIRLNWRADVRPPETSWLRLGASSGVTPGDLRLVIDPRGLAPGSYEADVVVRADQGGAPEVRLPVRLELGEAAAWPRIERAAHAADSSLPLAPGGLATLAGTALADGTAALEYVAVDRLPREAQGAQVLIKDVAGNFIERAPLLSVSPTSITFQTPYEAAGRERIRVTVLRDGREGEPVEANLRAASPGVLTSQGQPTLLNADGSLNGEANRAQRGSTVTVYFTGAGEPADGWDTGRAAPVENPLAIGEITVRIADQSGPAVAFLAPGFVGLAQGSAVVPETLSLGAHALRLEVAGVSSLPATLWVE